MLIRYVEIVFCVAQRKSAETAAQVIELMHVMSAEHGCAFLVVTHDANALPSFDRVVRLADGVLK